MVRAFVLILFFVGLVPLQSPASQENRILVLYPDAPSPYGDAFAQIIEGVRLSTNRNIIKYELPERYDIRKVQNWLDKYKNSAKSLVVLSKRALRASDELKHNLQVFASATDLITGKEQIPGVSMHIHPFIYVSHLKRLSPKTKKLMVFYNEKNKILIPLIEAEAENLNILVTPIAITDVEVAVRKIANVLDAIDVDTTAVWFTQNVIDLNTELLFPYILEKSWKRQIPVFSNMIAHTKRGFLFSLYPNYRGVGKELGDLLLKYESHSNGVDTLLIRSSKFVLNIRTAQHLDLMIDAATIKSADLIFPAR